MKCIKVLILSLSSHKVWVGCLSLILLLVAFMMGLNYAENDDVIMMELISGRYTGSFGEPAIFISPLFVYFLTALYKLGLGIEWYSFVFMVLTFITLLINLSFFLKKPWPLRFKLILGSVVFSFYLLFVTCLQFTTVAFCCASAGILILYDDLGKISWFGLAIFSVGFLIRYEAAVLALILWLPFILARVYVGFTKFVLIRCGLLLSIGLTFKSAEFLSAYQKQDLKTFYQWNSLRGRLHDNPNVLELSGDEYSSFISENDLKLFMDFVPDYNSFELSEIVNVARLSSRLYMPKVQVIFKEFYKFRFYLIWISVTLVFLFFSRYLERSFVWLLIIIISSIFYWMIAFSYLKFRVVVCVIYGVFMVVFMSMSDSVARRSTAIKFNFLLSVFFINASVLFLINMFLGTQFAVIGRDYSHTFDRNRVFLSGWAGRIVNASYLPLIDKRVQFLTSRSSCASDNLVFSGWVGPMPLSRRSFRSYLDLVDCNTLLLVARGREYIAQNIVVSIWENYRQKCDYRVVSEYPEFVLIKISRNEEGFARGYTLVGSK